MESLAFRLAEARKNSGLTQGQVAENLHITTQSVSSWECGNSIPDTEKLPEIAALYGVTTDWLLSGKLPAADPEEFYRALPFAPTGAQRRAVRDAMADMTCGKAMSRLVQGDVGSGKTLVAAALIWHCAENGCF